MSEIQQVIGMSRSHKDTLRWRCYYAAFERKHGRPSDGNEYDASVMSIVDVVLAKVRSELDRLVLDH